jgi:hypothetical protein
MVLVSAFAIPTSVAMTFGTLQLCLVEIHQVSIAALIIELGIVVENAIVIVDSYMFEGGLALHSKGHSSPALSTPDRGRIEKFSPIPRERHPFRNSRDSRRVSATS